MNIGETIRNFRLQRNMSQGDIEKRTGLLRCYLSRVENGHTIPSLDTLAKIAGAMDLALSQFFDEGRRDGHKGLPQLSGRCRSDAAVFGESERQRPEAGAGNGEENGIEHVEMSLSPVVGFQFSVEPLNEN